MDINKLPKILAVIGVVLILIGLTAIAFDSSRSRSLEERLITQEQQTETMRTRLISARGAYEEHAQKFVEHWSSNVREELNKSSLILTIENGELVKLLAEAREAQQARDFVKANAIAEQVDIQLHEASRGIDRILGPPATEGQGLYDQLLFKFTNADAQVLAASQAITDTRLSLNTKKADRWNSEHGLTFVLAEASLAEAHAHLTTARETLQRKVEGGLVDRPLGYDQSTDTIKLANQAITLAESDEKNAHEAWDQIANARIQIVDARTHINFSTYQQEQAFAVLAGAEVTLNSAISSFMAEDFIGAQNDAMSAQSQARSAFLTAATPTPIPTNTPTPRPTSTPVPAPVIIIVDSSDNDDSGSIFDSSANYGNDNVLSDSAPDFGTDDGVFNDNSWGDDTNTFSEDFGSDDGAWSDPDW